jgi:hypothetical protein
MLTASYLYLLCQAFDIRALQADFNRALASIVEEELSAHFGERLVGFKSSAFEAVLKSTLRALDSTTTMDAAPRMTQVAGASPFQSWWTYSPLVPPPLLPLSPRSPLTVPLLHHVRQLFSCRSERSIYQELVGEHQRAAI